MIWETNIKLGDNLGTCIELEVEGKLRELSENTNI